MSGNQAKGSSGTDHQMGQTNPIGKTDKEQVDFAKFPLDEKEALGLLHLLPPWTRSKENYLLLHEIRACMLAYPQFTPTSSALVLMFAGIVSSYDCMNIPPAISCLLEMIGPEKPPVPKNWLADYNTMMEQLDKDDLLKKRFDSAKHKLFDIRGIGSFLAGISTDLLHRMYATYYTMEDIPDDVLRAIGVELESVALAIAFTSSTEKSNDPEHEMALARLNAHNTAATTHRPVEKPVSESSKPKKVQTRQHNSFLCACSDESMREAVEIAFKGHMSIKWKIASDTTPPDFYFMRFDNRNTALNERQDMGPDTIVVVGYFAVKFGHPEKTELEKELKTAVSTVVWTEIFNDDSKSISELRLKDPDGFIKQIKVALDN